MFTNTTANNMRIKANPGIDNLTAYQMADLSTSSDMPLISLAQNELYLTPSAPVLETACRMAAEANRYPDAEWTELVTAIADVHNLDQMRIVCGAGSMELLEVLGRIYLSSGDAIVMSEYGYSFFKIVAQMYQAQINIAREINYTVEVDLLLKTVKPNTKIVFIANPGNPTGTLLPAAEIRRLRNGLADHILLIIDEAYAEFTDPVDYPALFDLTELNNTVILRTFSKIYGLAGMRVGWGYCPAQIYRLMRKVLNPNNLSSVSQACAAVAVQDRSEVQQRRDSVRSIKSAFCKALHAMGFATIDSHSNFVLIDFVTEQIAHAANVALKKQGLILRPVSNYGLPQCLRATISSRQHMNFATGVLRAFSENLFS